MSAVETGQMSAVETGQMSAVETRQIYSIKARQRSPAATVDICLSSMHLSYLNSRHLSSLNRRHLSCPSSRHLEGTKMISTPFLHLKCAKWSTPGGEAGAPEMEPHAAARSLSTPPKPSPRLYLGWLLLRVILEVFWVNWKVTKTISIPFF